MLQLLMKVASVTRPSRRLFDLTAVLIMRTMDALADQQGLIPANGKMFDYLGGLMI